jgi:hypothetical protein
MAVLHVRDFPPDLHKKLRGYANDDDTTLQALVVKIAEEYVERREAAEANTP